MTGRDEKGDGDLFLQSEPSSLKPEGEKVPVPFFVPAPEAAPGHGPPRTGARLLVLLALVAGALALWRTGERGLFTAHEARAARVARNMLRSDAWPADRPSPWLVPQFSADAPAGLNYQKPPLYYWAVAAVSAIPGDVGRVTTRLPSALSLVLLVLITCWLGETVASPRAGLVAALVLLSTPKIIWWGRAAILDPMLAACVAGSLLFFCRAHLGRGGRWQYWLFWGLAGLGTLVKATSLVIPLMAAGLYLLARAPSEGLWGPLRRIRPIAGPLVLLAVAAPWHVLAHAATGGEFSRIYWGMHVFGRAAGTSVFEKTTSWWFYFAAIARDLAPWVVFLPGALVQVWRRPSRADRPRLLFPFLWFAGALVFFSAVSFRKDEYLLVALPAAALLIGYLLDYCCCVRAREPDRAIGRWVEAAFWGVAGAAVVVGAALVAFAASDNLQQWVLARLADNETDRAVAAAMADQFGARPWLAPLLVGPMAAGSVGAVVALRRRSPEGALLFLVCASILACAAFIRTVEPTLDRTRGLSGFAAEVRALREKADRERGPTRVLLAVAECHELAFELDPDVVLLESLTARGMTVPQFLRPRLERGESWLMVVDRDKLTGDASRDGGLEFVEVYQMPRGHRRPMALLEPHLKSPEQGKEPEPDEQEGSEGPAARG